MAEAVETKPVGQVGMVKVFAAVFARAIVVVETVIANANFGAVATVNVVHSVVVVNCSAVFTAPVGFVSAIVTDENCVTVSVVGVVHVPAVVNFSALCTFRAVLFDAIRADVSAIDAGHLAGRIIFVAMTAVAETIFEAVLANVNAFAVFVYDAGDVVAMAAALVAGFATFGVALIAVEPFGGFFAAADAEAVSADVEGLKVVEVLQVNGNFSAKI